MLILEEPPSAPAPAVDRPRKRVRFSDLYEDDDEEDWTASVPTALPDADDLDDADEREYQPESVGPIKDVDPQAAAKKRAARRQEAAAAAALVAAALSEVGEEREEDAEEDDPEESVGYNEAGEAVPLEPFNLSREREEGYFDADGSYVEYRLDGLTDAWLEELSEKQQSLRIDGTDASQLVQRAKASAQDTEEEAQPKQLDEEDRAVYKGRIVAMLQPGETVLQALRRLANMQQMPQHQQQQGRKKGGQRQRGNQDRGAVRGGEGGEEEDDDDDGPSDSLFTLQQQGRSGERQRLKKLAKLQQEQQRQQQQGQGQGQGKEPAPAATDAPSIAADGRTGGIAAPFCSVASASPSGAASEAGRSGPSTGSSPAAAYEADRSGSAAGSSQAAATQPLRPPLPLRLDRRVPVENSVEFDKLTGYADLLLGQSEFDIYSKTREQIEREVAALASAAASGEGEEACGGSSTSASTRAAASALVASLLGINLPPVGAASDTAPPSDQLPATQTSQSGVAAAVLSPSPQLQQQQQRGTDRAVTSVPADGGDGMAVDDMFACDFVAAQQHPQAAAGAGSAAHGVGPSSGVGEDGGGVTPMEVLQEGTALPQAGEDEGMIPEPHVEEGDYGGEEALQGFVLDPDSGLYYNSALGYYFDPGSQRWRDAGTGVWYRVEDGQYIAD